MSYPQGMPDERVSGKVLRTMQHGIMLSGLVALLLLGGCSGDQGDEPGLAETSDSVTPVIDPSADIQRAKASIGAFASSLKSELTAAMQDGGPLNAIEVCNTQAVVIRDQVTADSGLNLRRVSLRNRNPENTPNEWQRVVLESFDELQRAGNDPGQLDWHEIVLIDGEKEFRYMKAIPTAGLCLQCHGKTLATEVAQAIRQLYPDDKATGYSPGEIRGAFVVTNRR